MISDICISYFAGVLWTLAFESPVIVMEKIMFAKVEQKDINKKIEEKFVGTTRKSDI